jgi:hypothetical protein
VPVLRRALAATPGPWTVTDTGPTCVHLKLDERIRRCRRGRGGREPDGGHGDAHRERAYKGRTPNNTKHNNPFMENPANPGHASRTQSML